MGRHCSCRSNNSCLKFSCGVIYRSVLSRSNNKSVSCKIGSNSSNASKCGVCCQLIRGGATIFEHITGRCRPDFCSHISCRYCAKGSSRGAGGIFKTPKTGCAVIFDARLVLIRGRADTRHGRRPGNYTGDCVGADFDDDCFKNFAVFRQELSCQAFFVICAERDFRKAEPAGQCGKGDYNCKDA